MVERTLIEIQDLLDRIAPMQNQTFDQIVDRIGDFFVDAAGSMVSIGVIILVTLIALRLLRSLVRRIIREVLQSREGTSRELSQRAETLAGIVESTGRYVILFIATLTVLSDLGINLAPVLASAGIAGLAIAFGAQALISDIFNGFFILLEGQFAVGDFIRVGQLSGTVEEFSLRRTVIRSMDGAAVTIPNSDIRTVENLSKGWSRAVIDIAVAPEADIQQVLDILHAELDDIQQDPEFGEHVIEQPNILGMTDVEPNRLIFRAMIKTAPMQQWKIQREVRNRIRDRLIADGVPMPPRTLDLLAGNPQ
ncbi:MAG: mechanosensitive ion channel family protein [Chloroflexota bacterium]